MALPPALASAVSRYKVLPRNQQMAVLFGVPAALFVLFAWLMNAQLKILGPDLVVPGILRKDAGIWTEIEGVRVQVTEKEAIIARKPEIEAKLAAIQSDIQDAEDRLPREAEKAQMREVIERLAREIPQDLGSVAFKSVRILEDGEAGGGSGGAARRGRELKTITYQVEVTGDLNGIIKYIDSIEKNKRFMMVNQLSIRGGGVLADKENKKVKVEPHQVKMDIVTYVYSAAAKPRATP